MTIANVAPGTIVETMHKSYGELVASGIIVRVDRTDPSSGRVKVWRNFRQGSTMFHPTTIVRTVEPDDDMRF